MYRTELWRHGQLVGCLYFPTKQRAVAAVEHAATDAHPKFQLTHAW